MEMSVTYMAQQKLQTSNTKPLTFAAGAQVGVFSMKWLERRIKTLIVLSITLPLKFPAIHNNYFNFGSTNYNSWLRGHDDFYTSHHAIALHRHH